MRIMLQKTSIKMPKAFKKSIREILLNLQGTCLVQTNKEEVSLRTSTNKI